MPTRWSTNYLKTFVSDGDAKGYVGAVCSGSKHRKQQWRMEEKTQEFKISNFSLTKNVRLAAFRPPKKFLPRTSGPTCTQARENPIGTSFLVFYSHFFSWLTNLSDPQTAGPQTSNTNQVGGTLCISIASTTLFGGYLRFSKNDCITFNSIPPCFYYLTNLVSGS